MKKSANHLHETVLFHGYSELKQHFKLPDRV